MPTFVPVTDPEKPKNEQSFFSEDMLQHRQFDLPHAVIKTTEGMNSGDNNSNQKRGWAQGEVGWGNLNSYGSSERDDGAQIVRRSEGSSKMVKNEKGLWVKSKETESHEVREGKGRGGRGISVLQKYLQDQDAHNNTDDVQADSEQFRDADEEQRPSRQRESGKQRSRSPDAKKDRNRERERSRERNRSRDRRYRRDRSRTRSRSPGRRKRDDSHDHRRRRSRERGNDSRDRRRDRHSSRSPKRRSSSRERRHRRRRSESRSSSSEEDRRRSRHDSHGKKSFDKHKESKQSLSKSTVKSDSEEEEKKSKERVSKIKVSEDEETSSPRMMDITVIQVLNHFHEVYSTKSVNRLTNLVSIFAENAKICSLRSEQKIYLSGRTQIQESFQKTHPTKVIPSKRIYFEIPQLREQISSEIPSPSFYSYACDLHRAATSPGLGDLNKDTILLYECCNQYITTVWGMNDTEQLAQQEHLTEDVVYESKVWTLITGILRKRWQTVLDQHNIDLMIVAHYHNYDQMEVWGM